MPQSLSPTSIQPSGSQAIPFQCFTLVRDARIPISCPIVIIPLVPFFLYAIVQLLMFEKEKH